MATVNPLPHGAPDHAARMDAIYGVQRHFYDLTRKYYLLGRDRLIRDLDVPEGGSVLEVGCGTGRNLIKIGKTYRSAALYGLDISAQMLRSAEGSLSRAKLSDRSHLARGDAGAFDPQQLFGHAGFDRIVLSYTLSMVPDWRAAVDAAIAALAPGGRLHIVDFGDSAGLPRSFGRLLRGWLARFDVTPRTSLFDYCRDAAQEQGKLCTTRRLYRGYAWSVVIFG
jgi:S-adenosylmethionine-diacylgycerolhomoserine-N-methlytransferase